MEKKSQLRKGLVVGIIILFIGTSIPSCVGVDLTSRLTVNGQDAMSDGHINERTPYTDNQVEDHTTDKVPLPVDYVDGIKLLILEFN